ncbi:HlyD family efflux transporter periplasmic adaptor subunit [Massilia sp. S19_KUP03_FR1]|uniref:HlyD family efflux transporter periplasmic adaptor subunit n=1 Tax=Massilia sp. S19_KUP03_FR1 TaxID=3025503 RepID=UPI002FCDCBD2
MVHLVNEVRSLVPYDQAIVYRRGAGGSWRAAAVSGLHKSDPDTPLLHALGVLIARRSAMDSVGAFEPAAAAAAVALAEEQLASIRQLPFSHALWAPLPDLDERVDAGVLFLKELPFQSGAQVLLKRLGETYGHAWVAIAGRRRRQLPAIRRRWTAGAIVLVLIALGAMPVRLSVMAPVEVVAAQPHVMTAPISGVVKRIAVAPGTMVKAGALLVHFEDVAPRNEMLLSQQRLAVAEARNARITAAAFQDPTAAHELAAARAEQELAKVTYDYAVEVLARTVIRAPADGVVLYSDRRDLEGRAVQVGEEILQVAAPAHVALRADLSTSNSLPLKEGDRADVFLENAPLGGLPARIRYATYTPRVLPGGDTAYTVMMDPELGQAPRIGARGTVRLHGPDVPLAVQLLRRPLSVLRQTLAL